MTHRTAPTVSVIVPVFNKLPFLPPTLDSILAAMRRHGAAELILVDNLSTDGSWEYLQRYADRAQVLRTDARTIAAVRNFGARHASGRILSFLDSDVVLREDYFVRLEETFAGDDLGGAGCECDIPDPAHWTERVWFQLHAVLEDGDVHYINSANFALRRDVFDAVGGFDEQLTVAEDTDISRRIREHGYRLREAQVLRVIHLANPKSLAAFYRKQVWHGVSVLDDGSIGAGNKASLMVLANTALVALALGVLLVPGLAWPVRVGTAAALVLAAPVLAIAYRLIETRRSTSLPLALVLYVTYFAARTHALLAALGRRLKAPPAIVTRGAV